MQTWAWGLVSYAVSHALHVVIWRARTPNRQVVALFGILCAPAALVAYYSIPAAITHFSCAASYIALYPAFQAVSPTIQILELLRKMPSGAPRNQLVAAFASPSLVSDRVADLMRGGLLIQNEESARLTWRGRLLARFFIVYRSLLGLAEGGG